MNTLILLFILALKIFNSSLRKKYLSKFNNIYIPSDIFHQIAHSSFLQRRFLQINKHPSKNLIYPDEETNSFSKMNTLILLFILSNRSKPEFEFYLSGYNLTTEIFHFTSQVRFDDWRGPVGGVFRFNSGWRAVRDRGWQKNENPEGIRA